ncbi:MAG: M81 family metallopeptidase [Pirellulaceae bacterium]
MGEVFPERLVGLYVVSGDNAEPMKIGIYDHRSCVTLTSRRVMKQIGKGLNRVGILALLHESNTFLAQPTTLDRFHEDLYVEGPSMRERLADSHHEIGGFFSGLASSAGDQRLEVVPLFAARATPSGPIAADAFDFLVSRILELLAQQLPLDGLLIAAHGAAVSVNHLDADGYWLSRVRQAVGATIPIIATLDPHANLSPAMVDACNALVAYRTNPHLDQRQRGEEAAKLMLATLEGEVRPCIAASFPPLVINIERQSTAEPHLQKIFNFADEQRTAPKVLSNSLILGFPYADVAEMGAATIVVTDDDPALARQLADELAQHVWDDRQQMIGVLTDIEQALELCETHPHQRVCLLDMGDNVGGGSAADGTVIAAALCRRNTGPAFVCLVDRAAVEACMLAGVGASLELSQGGHTDAMHGEPLRVCVQIESFHDGIFHETLPRHGGITQFDQGDTVVVRAAEHPLTIMLTSRRMVPFSLNQLISCGVQPEQFRVLVAKGVHAPLAAYRDVCDRFIRVNTPGITCADLNQLQFNHRRRPLFPFEPADFA